MARIIGKGYSFDDVLIVPKYNRVNSRKDVSFRTKVTKNHYLDIPLLVANMDTVCESKMAITVGKLGGLGVIHRFMTLSNQIKEVQKVKKEKLLTAAAIGVKDYEERVKALVNVGCDILVLDVAHGHSKRVGKTLDYIKKEYPKIDIIVGNIATKDAAEYFISKKADAIKVGIGPGSMCTTRIMAGAGVPQITAIMDVYEASQGRVPICADGGIKISGDLVKAIGAGADTVMLGSLFSGTEESPGKIIIKNGKKFKEYRGMASYLATVKKMALDGVKKEEVVHVEGEMTLVEYKGSVVPIVNKLLGGLASGMTYMGADGIEKIKGKADFISITGAGIKESIAHGLLKN
ncbi:guanosine monophosphate reductase [Candidatus Falkowbacteria bacterium HGW-Falkowbacteria-1]|uniref:Guanosine monophosphate reductase n=1 Tax=Candidatus Falkowbacteria bacterium HGW-Falkowbacteria-1 TaxID=2013768 RepID=A0A2N2E9D6_9BACT|nr:MAG: guanosine monophosphate reductase [Candidatus Falkowbacteria bacterium HGW-Falkowbacteria-1]